MLVNMVGYLNIFEDLQLILYTIARWNTYAPVNCVIIGSANGLSFLWHQSTTWANP